MWIVGRNVLKVLRIESKSKRTFEVTRQITKDWLWTAKNNIIAELISWD
jgi:hypothetical protein